MKEDHSNDGRQTWNSNPKKAAISPDSYNEDARKDAYINVTKRACVAILTEENGATVLERRQRIAETIVQNANEVGYDPRVLAMLSLPGIETMDVVGIARILAQLKKITS